MAASTKKTGDPVYDTFIRRSLGTILPECIKQLSESRPADPIEFISNSLYKAMDSVLYKREKEKYLSDCVRESSLLQRQREERKARLDMLLQAQKENKEKLRQARQDEIDALTHLAENAELYGVQVSPKSMRRLKALKRESQLELESERPLQISMKEKSQTGKWVEFEEVITNENGVVFTIKSRKWVTNKQASKAQMKEVDGEKKSSQGTSKQELDSVDVAQESQASQGKIALTSRGIFTYSSEAFGDVQPPDPLDRRLAPADNPDIWARQRFDCHTLYDHELYIRCDADVGLDTNQHASPPRHLVREYLESLSRGSSSEEATARSLGQSEGEGHTTDADGGNQGTLPKNMVPSEKSPAADNIDL